MSYLIRQQAQRVIQNPLRLDEIEDRQELKRLISERLQLMISLVCQMNQEQPLEKLFRNKLLTEMMRLIYESQSFFWIYKKHEKYQDISDEKYEDCCNNAILETYKYLREKPNNYDPNHESGASVITWLNNYLKWQLFDLIQEARKIRQQNLYPIQGDESFNIIDTVEASSDSEKAIILLNNMRNWAENDPELQTIHIRNSPNITASQILLRRLPPEEAEWQEIAKEFGVGVSTLSSFYERQCRPRLIEYVQSIGYEIPDTPVDPVQDIKLIIEKVTKIYKNQNIIIQLKEWVNTETKLSQIFCKNKPELTAFLFLEKLLNLLETKSKLQTKFFAEILNITARESEKFYEYRIQPELHNLLENKGYIIKDIYK